MFPIIRCVNLVRQTYFGIKDTQYCLNSRVFALSYVCSLTVIKNLVSLRIIQRQFLQVWFWIRCSTDWANTHRFLIVFKHKIYFIMTSDSRIILENHYYYAQGVWEEVKGSWHFRNRFFWDLRINIPISIAKYTAKYSKQESIPVGCVPPACQPDMFWWPPLGVRTGGGWLGIQGSYPPRIPTPPGIPDPTHEIRTPPILTENFSKKWEKYKIIFWSHSQ